MHHVTSVRETVSYVMETLTQPWATLLAAAVTALAPLTLGYVVGRWRTEHQEHYARLVERRVEIAAELYRLLHELANTFRSWQKAQASDDGSQFANNQVRSQRDQIKQKVEELADYLAVKDVWLTDRIRLRVENEITNLRNITEQDLWLAMELPKQDERSLANDVDRWLNYGFEETRKELRADLQEMVGMKESASQRFLRVVIDTKELSLIGFGFGVLLSFLTSSIVIIVAGGLALMAGTGLLLRRFGSPRNKTQEQKVE